MLSAPSVFALPSPKSGEDNPDLFTESIVYDRPNYYIPGAQGSQYNGNISQIVWQVAGREKQAYSFKYDNLDRMIEADYADVHNSTYAYHGWSAAYKSDNKFQEKVSYDMRGNIKTLERNGLTQNTNTYNGFVSGRFGKIDNLTYTYDATDNNKLVKVADAASLTLGFKSINNAVATQYAYDANGNLISDVNKGIINIVYNHLNLPLEITFSATRKIQFIYDATGAKLRKITTDNATVVTTNYVNGTEYNGNVVERIPHTEGSVVNSGGTYVYEYILKDHLGNTRVTFGNADGTGIVANSDIKQINHYYAFGLNMEGPGFGAQGANKYTYNGKEWNNDFGLGLNDYGARMYDPAIGRWNSVDPLAEKFFDMNPYNYVKNNPINMIDPNGMESIYSMERNENGGGTITISAKVFLTGSQSSKDGAKAANEKAAEMFKGGKYKDADGNEWNVKIDVTFEHKDKISRDDLKEGENILNMDGKTDRSEVEGGLGTSPFQYGEMRTGADATETVHEAGHLLGLSDRYSDIGKKSVSHEGYEKDLMGASPTSKATEFSQAHIDDFGSFALRRSADLQYGSGNPTVPVNRFISKSIVDWRRDSAVKK